MKRFFTISLGITFLLIPLWLSNSFAENRALLIGIGKYDISDANLPGIDIDIENMRYVAKAMGFSGDQIQVLQDRDATLNAIERSIKGWLIDSLLPGDRGFLYISSHGSGIPDQGKKDERDDVDETLLPTNTAYGDGTLKNVLVDDRLAELLAQIRTDEFYVMIDACHSGTATKTVGLYSDQKAKFFKYPGMPGSSKSSYSVEAADADNYAFLSAAQDDESALATSRGSLFTLGVFQAVKAAKRNGQPLTLRQLKKEAGDFIRSNASPEKIHRPNLTGSESLMNRNLFVRATDSKPELWGKLEHLVDAADYKVALSVKNKRQKVGDRIVLQCEVPYDGYLNIVEVGEGDEKPNVLFPNKYHTENEVSKGTTIAIPSREFGRFKLVASQPGKSLIVAIISEEPNNAHKDGIDVGEHALRKMSKITLDKANISVEESNGFGAGSVVTYVEQ